MLDVDRGVDVDPGGEHLLDVLPAFFMAAAGRIGVGQFIDQGQRRFSCQDGVKVQFGKRYPLVFVPGQQSIGFHPAVGFDIGGNHLAAFRFELTGGLQHGVGFADPGGVA